jgi:hypothetical protein
METLGQPYIGASIFRMLLSSFRRRFGLSESALLVKGSGGALAVCQKILDVTYEPFLCQAGIGNTGNKACWDITVLNGLRIIAMGQLETYRLRIAAVR